MAKLGLIQYDADRHFGDRATNLAKLTALTELAIDDGARIVLHPEGSTWGYVSRDEIWAHPALADGRPRFAGRRGRDVSTIAELVPGGPTTRHWAAIARARGTFVAYHLPERDSGRFYSTLGVVGPDGFVLKYRKRVLYRVDQAFARAGQRAAILDTPWGRFGLMICLDATYDGPLYDDYVGRGVDGILIAMDWDDDPHGPMAARTWLANRAAHNGVPLFAADSPRWDGTGKYPPGAPRERVGLADPGVGVEGLSVHPLRPRTNS